MLEISQVKSQSNYKKFIKSKNIPFKSTNNQKAQAASALVPASQLAGKTNSLKNLINIVPDSYADEIGGVVLAAGIAILSRNKSKKLQQQIAKMAEQNTNLTKNFENLKKGIGTAANNVEDGVQGVLKKAQGLVDDAKTAMGIETDSKISKAISSFKKGTVLTETVEANGANFKLATIYGDSRIKGTEKEILVKQLKSEAAKRILGIGSGWSKIPEKGEIAIVTSEFKGYASTGGLSAVPKDIADNMVRIIAKNGTQDINTTVYMPLYLGRVEPERLRFVRAGKNGVYEYVERAKNKEGIFANNVIAEMKKVYSFQSKVIDDESLLDKTVNVYQSRQLVPLSEYNVYLKRLSAEDKKMVETLTNGREFQSGNLLFKKEKDGQNKVYGVIKSIFFDNGQGGKFDLNIAQGNATTIYNTNALSSGETERFMYFNKFLYDFMLDRTKSSEQFRDPTLILGNDWHVGGLVSMMRLLTPVKKAYGEIPPELADKIYNTPCITILHNAGLSGGAWHSQEKLLNILYGDKASTIVPNAHVNIFAEGKTPSLDGRLWNGLLAGSGEGNVGVNPQMMAATYSDYVVPVSKGYAKEISTNDIFGYERRQLYEIRAKKGAYGLSDVMKTVAKNNGFENVDEKTIVQPTLKGITNGSDTEKNILTDKLIADIEKNLGIEKGRLKPYKPGMDVLTWRNNNKQVGIDVLKRDTEIARKTAGKENPMKIVNPQDVDLSDITVDTPIFVSAGRITDQKGIDIWAESIVDFYKKYKGDNPPVFYLQGIKQAADDQKLIDAFMKAKETVVKINPKAAKRMLYAGLFSEAGRFDIAKIFSDFPVMPSKFEPCGLSHKEISKFSCAIPIVNKTGGLMDGLEDGVTAIASDFDASKSVEENGQLFANAQLRAMDIYKKTPKKFAQMVEAWIKTKFDWASEGGPIYEYTELMEKLGVLNHGTATEKMWT